MCVVFVCLVFASKYVLGQPRVSQPLNLRLCLLRHLAYRIGRAPGLPEGSTRLFLGSCFLTWLLFLQEQIKVIIIIETRRSGEGEYARSGGGPAPLGGLRSHVPAPETPFQIHLPNSCVTVRPPYAHILLGATPWGGPLLRTVKRPIQCLWFLPHERSENNPRCSWSAGMPMY